ncbi:unnamed protein product, partial [Ectocarpus sp. 13 AM-2016]
MVLTIPTPPLVPVSFSRGIGQSYKDAGTRSRAPNPRLTRSRTSNATETSPSQCERTRPRVMRHRVMTQSDSKPHDRGPRKAPRHHAEGGGACLSAKMRATRKLDTRLTRAGGARCLSPPC